MQRRRSHRRRSTQEEKKTATSKLVQTSGRWLSASLAKHLNSIYISTHKSIDQGKISTMARGKVQLKRIENPVHRQVTFCKRRAGLLKKAKELSILCDSDIGVFIFSPQGKLYELATKGTMEGLMERYMKCTRGPQAESVAKKDQLLESDAKQYVPMFCLLCSCPDISVLTRYVLNSSAHGIP
ncbi:hypothetical protein Nepgr_002522 [Nepenthes gracilis]|uniref:MADS-box domain-containing protein n=1 Tax=Nepenthes gracilis TaxID=150966 RepID=A0AAD3P8X2_NEPGR|nr:hypothetical protein Nepgr_002522 [Nepenthes gracilis]